MGRGRPSWLRGSHQNSGPRWGWGGAHLYQWKHRGACGLPDPPPRGAEGTVEMEAPGGDPRAEAPGGGRSLAARLSPRPRGLLVKALPEKTSAAGV
jgi:hypothetical protein